jgi:hypothetical protein
MRGTLGVTDLAEKSVKFNQLVGQALDVITVALQQLRGGPWESTLREIERGVRAAVMLLDDAAVPLSGGDKHLDPAHAAACLRNLERALRAIRATLATGTSPTHGQLRAHLDQLTGRLVAERRALLAEAALLAAARAALDDAQRPPEPPDASGPPVS